MSVPILEFQNVEKRFNTQTVLKNINLTFHAGKIYVLTGASGSGKTTTLRLMNGLEKPTSGQVHFNGVPLDYSSIVEARRQMGYCIQGSGLFPHMTVLENVSLVPKRLRLPMKGLLSRASELMEMVGLAPKQYLHKKPLQLSGGEKQRVGIVRALMLTPRVLLMDEPFGALDPIIRKEIQDAFIQLQKQLAVTVIMVTHDIQEAIRLGHEMILLRDGNVEQFGDVHSFLENPKSDYVTAFMKANAPIRVLKDIYEERVQS